MGLAHQASTDLEPVGIAGSIVAHPSLGAQVIGDFFRSSALFHLQAGSLVKQIAQCRLRTLDLRAE